MVKANHLRILLAFLLIFLLAACSGQRVLMPTPNVHVGSGENIYTGLPAELKTTEVPLFYITDRQPTRDDKGHLDYGYGRSSSLAFGSMVVDLGEDITWEELLEASRIDKRLKEVPLKRGVLTEIIRGADIPVPYKEIDGRIVEEPLPPAKNGHHRRIPPGHGAAVGTHTAQGRIYICAWIPQRLQ